MGTINSSFRNSVFIISNLVIPLRILLLQTLSPVIRLLFIPSSGNEIKGGAKNRRIG